LTKQPLGLRKTEIRPASNQCWFDIKTLEQFDDVFWKPYWSNSLERQVLLPVTKLQPILVEGTASYRFPNFMFSKENEKVLLEIARCGTLVTTELLSDKLGINRDVINDLLRIFEKANLLKSIKSLVGKPLGSRPKYRCLAGLGFEIPSSVNSATSYFLVLPEDCWHIRALMQLLRPHPIEAGIRGLLFRWDNNKWIFEGENEPNSLAIAHGLIALSECSKHASWCLSMVNREQLHIKIVEVMEELLKFRLSDGSFVRFCSDLRPRVRETGLSILAIKHAISALKERLKIEADEITERTIGKRERDAEDSLKWLMKQYHSIGNNRGYVWTENDLREYSTLKGSKYDVGRERLKKDADAVIKEKINRLHTTSIAVLAFLSSHLSEAQSNVVRNCVNWLSDVLEETIKGLQYWFEAIGPKRASSLWESTFAVHAIIHATDGNDPLLDRFCSLFLGKRNNVSFDWDEPRPFMSRVNPLNLTAATIYTLLERGYDPNAELRPSIIALLKKMKIREDQGAAWDEQIPYSDALIVSTLIKVLCPDVDIF